ncbi:MAG: hypothetical protein PVH65_06630 [Chloroflexota bacterium]|jgi:hypothetical protein
MTEQEPSIEERVRNARDKLAEQYLDHSAVALIDIGYAPEILGFAPQTIALRIHVREHWLQISSRDEIPFPAEVDGVPVILIPGDYHLEDGNSADHDSLYGV